MESRWTHLIFSDCIAAVILLHSLKQEAMNKSSFRRQTFHAHSTPDNVFYMHADRNNLLHPCFMPTGRNLWK